MKLFDVAFDHVIMEEGGYVDDPDDRGGKTKYGISNLAYPTLDIKNLTVEQAKVVYYRDYWLKSTAPLLDGRLSNYAFETAVNMGVSTSNKLVQSAFNLYVDGHIGDKSKAELNKPENLNLDGIHFIAVSKSLIVARIQLYMLICERRSSNFKYLRGWIARTLRSIK